MSGVLEHDGADGDGLFTWLVETSAADPERRLVRGVDGDVIREVSARELEERARALAQGLASLGVGSDSTIAVWLPNRVEWMVCQFACAALGTAVLGLNTRYRSHEVSHLLNTVDLSAIVLPSEFLNIDFVGTLRAALASDESVVSVPHLIFLGDVPDGAREVAGASHRFADLSFMGSWAGDGDHGVAMSNLFTTSGSTSAPKVAGHDQASIVRHGRAGAAALNVRDGDRLLAVLPLCGVFGFSAIMAILLGGGSIDLVETFDAPAAAHYLDEFKITHVVGGDEMLGAIFDHVGEGVSLTALRRGGIANFAGRAKDVVLDAERRWGAVLSGVYGSSELFALTSVWPVSVDASIRGLGGGVLVDAGIEVRVRDLESDAELPEGQAGELQFRGYNVISGYLNNPVANATSFTADGWFKTGDLGYLGHGGLVYQCRAREAMRLRGFLVEPGEIEDFLSQEASIDEVHVVGVDVDGVTKAFAFARARPGDAIDEAAILQRARTSLAAFKVPERVIEIEEFPTTTGTNGTKVRFDALRDLARTELGVG